MVPRPGNSAECRRPGVRPQRGRRTAWGCCRDRHSTRCASSSCILRTSAPSAAGADVLCWGRHDHCDLRTGAPATRLSEVLASLPAGWHPDLIVFGDDSRLLYVIGLEEAPCPTVMLSVDAHHHAGGTPRWPPPATSPSSPSATIFRATRWPRVDVHWMPLWAPTTCRRPSPRRPTTCPSSARSTDPQSGAGRVRRRAPAAAAAPRRERRLASVFGRSRIVLNQTVKADLNFACSRRWPPARSSSPSGPATVSSISSPTRRPRHLHAQRRRRGSRDGGALPRRRAHSRRDRRRAARARRARRHCESHRAAEVLARACGPLPELRPEQRLAGAGRAYGMLAHYAGRLAAAGPTIISGRWARSTSCRDDADATASCPSPIGARDPRHDRARARDVTVRSRLDFAATHGSRPEDHVLRRSAAPARRSGPVCDRDALRAAHAAAGRAGGAGASGGRPAGAGLQLPRRSPAHARVAAATPLAGAVVAATTGVPTLAIGGVLLHSRHDPMGEATRWAATQRDLIEAGADTAVVLGFGLGYHVEALAAVWPGRIVVVEPDAALLATAFAARDLRALLARVELAPDAIGSDVIDGWGRVAVAAHAPRCCAKGAAAVVEGADRGSHGAARSAAPHPRDLAADGWVVSADGILRPRARRAGTFGHGARHVAVRARSAASAASRRRRPSRSRSARRSRTSSGPACSRPSSITTPTSSSAWRRRRSAERCCASWAAAAPSGPCGSSRTTGCSATGRTSSPSTITFSRSSPASSWRRRAGRRRGRSRISRAPPTRRSIARSPCARRSAPIWERRSASSAPGITTVASPFARCSTWA